MSKEIIEYLKQKLSDSKYDDYTVFVMARKELESGDLQLALNRIRVDLDKLICIDKELYNYISNLIYR